MNKLPEISEPEPKNQTQLEFSIPETLEDIFEISNRNRKKNKERKKNKDDGNKESNSEPQSVC